MNRKLIERQRDMAQRDVDYLKNYKGHVTKGPATLMEAYRRADWNAAVRMVHLFDALLAEDEKLCANAKAREWEAAVESMAEFIASIRSDRPLLDSLANWSA